MKKNSNSGMRKNKDVIKWSIQHIRQDAGRLTLLGIGRFIQAVLSVAFALGSRRLVNDALDGLNGYFMKQAGLLALILISNLLLGYLLNIGANVLEKRWNIRLRGYMFTAIQEIQYDKTRAYHSGALLDRLYGDVESLNQNIMDIVQGTVSIASSVALAFATLYMMDPLIPVALCVISVLFLLPGRIYKKSILKNQNAMADADAQRRGYYQEALANGILLRAYQAQLKSGERAYQYERRSFDMWKRWYMLRQKMKLGVSFFFNISYIMALAICAYGIYSNRISYGDMIAALQLVNMFQSPISELSGQLSAFYTALASAGRLMELDEMPREKPETLVDAARVYSQMIDIGINDLTFGYNEKPILHNLKFKLKKGDFTVLIGKSGSGKTTLFMLLIGIYAPDSGAITLHTASDDIDVNSRTRSLFAYVPQEQMLFSGSLRDNLTFFCGTRTPEQITDALRIACAEEFLGEKSEGLDTLIQENGAGLSEGQKQRLCIARAILSSAPILLFDEVTSSLDMDTEKRLIKNLRQLNDRTILFITHRMAVADMCDNVFCLRDGELCEV